MRIGLVGYGAWGHMHAAAIGRIDGLSLAAVLCHSDQSATLARQELPGVVVHRDLATLLADPAIDLVDIVVPNHLHAGMAVAALEAGKHVLLEKPMATTIVDAERIVAAVERSGRYLGVGLELHVSRQWAKVRALITEGAIGRAKYANLTLFRRPFRGGSGNWRRTSSTVGSWILEEPIHYVDLLLWYFREHGLPVEVSADGVPSPVGAGMYDAFTATMRFAGGAYAVFSQCLGGFEHSLVLEIAGDQGALRTWWSGAMDRTHTPDFELKLRRAGTETAETVPIEKSGEVFELEEQLRRLVDDVPRRTPLVSACDALPSLRICLEIERALAECRAVRLAWP
ncbi:MAG: Gfo/Idh/MocA family protein [Reyranella sp.]|uniref:Gfo/Idh/MocA family protein n=1 Tax=Reyranella sp. TaxID=1929291 RepID=UPI003D146013